MGRIPKLALQVSLALLLLFALLFIYASIAPPPDLVPSPFDPGRYKAAEEDDIRLALADPDGAKFRNDEATVFHRVPTVCGEINVRNSSNGYVGYRRFVSGSTIRKIEDAPGNEEMSRLWLVLCGREK